MYSLRVCFAAITRAPARRGRFDFIVVALSLVALGPLQVPVVVIRSMRAFRIARLFRRIKSLSSIIMALTASIIPVINAYLVLLIAMCICELSCNAPRQRANAHPRHDGRHQRDGQHQEDMPRSRAGSDRQACLQACVNFGRILVHGLQPPDMYRFKPVQRRPSARRSWISAFRPGPAGNWVLLAVDKRHHISRTCHDEQHQLDAL
jgi:ABC-type nickel/cobalt efflux system permease component RcnA